MLFTSQATSDAQLVFDEQDKLPSRLGFITLSVTVNDQVSAFYGFRGETPRRLTITTRPSALHQQQVSQGRLIASLGNPPRNDDAKKTDPPVPPHWRTATHNRLDPAPLPHTNPPQYYQSVFDTTRSLLIYNALRRFRE